MKRIKYCKTFPYLYSLSLSERCDIALVLMSSSLLFSSFNFRMVSTS